MGKLIILFLLVVVNIIECTAKSFAIQPHAIKFDRAPLSQAALAGADVSFTCSANVVDEPTLPQFIWYHNDSEIINASISNVGINTSTLFIFNVSEMDQGKYYCIIKDWETRTKSKSGKLLVYADDSESKPLNATFNETVILQCHPEGIKPRLIQWLKDEKSINFSDDKFHQLQDGSLVILHVNGSDNGEYSCDTVLSGRRVKLQSYAMLVGTNQLNGPAVLLYPTNSTHFVANMTVACRIPTSLEVYNVTWTMNETAINSATEDVEVIQYDLLKIRRMGVSSNYYRCVVYRNVSDKSPIISPPLVVYKRYAPALKYSNSTDHYICTTLNSSDLSCINGTNQNVSLYCSSVGGFPVPTITWYHNGDEIFNATIVNGALMLNKSACALLGTYQCLVSNEVSSEIVEFRVLPYGWPNGPKKPKISTKGKTLFVSLERPVYLGGLDSSLVDLEIYVTDSFQLTNITVNEDYDCNSTSNKIECSTTVSYRELRSGLVRIYYSNLTIKEPRNTMCHGYSPSSTISKNSIIDVTTIVEFAPPLVNLSCSEAGYANVTSQPIGSLSSDELWNNGFISEHKLNWSCVNSIGESYDYEIDKNWNYDFEIRWKSYNCSVDVHVVYEAIDKKVVHRASKYCLSSNFTKSASKSADILLTQPASSTIILVNTTTMIYVTPTLNTFLSTFTSKSTFDILPTNQVTPNLSSLSAADRNNYESSLADSTIIAVVLSSVIIIIILAFVFIFIGLFCYKRRKEQVHKFNMAERKHHCSLDSIPKTYSYIGKEDQSTCEKPNPKVVNWINSLNDTHDREESTSINSDGLSNEQMLDVLYGPTKDTQTINEKAIGVTSAVQGRSVSFISEEEVSTMPSTMLADNAVKFTTRVKSDIPMADSTKYHSALPVARMEDGEMAYHPSLSDLSNEIQIAGLSYSLSLSSIDSIFDSQMLSKHKMKDKDTCPYISVNNMSKKHSTATDPSSHGEYMEYDDIARKQIVTAPSHDNKS